MEGYIKDIRSAIGTMPIILNFACVCIYDEQGRILLQARDKELTQWGFPGGALEYGESFTEAAIRECKEETGYEVAIDKYIGIFDKYFASYPNGDAQTIVAAYTGHIVSGEEFIDGQETYALKWFTADEIPTLFNEQNQDIYATLKTNS